MIMTTRLKPIRRIPAPMSSRSDEGSRDLRPDPADLAATLRDLTTCAHRAVRAVDKAAGEGRPATTALRELAELHPRIVALQEGLNPVTQQGLASYLSALRREVESRLG
jgi:hypothetical protein